MTIRICEQELKRFVISTTSNFADRDRYARGRKSTSSRSEDLCSSEKFPSLIGEEFLANRNEITLNGIELRESRVLRAFD